MELFSKRMTWELDNEMCIRDRDRSMREFAAKKLTELANEWQADDDEKENADPITEEAFAQRITCLLYTSRCV